ncbi:MAG: hypothetical protein E6Q97_00870 [Desulfurellales bacterium]|nr:MAG: hypothetical protein E6Q97_00870 [Desulfurellales bacterium]
MTMIETKPAIQSLGVWGALLSLAPALDMAYQSLAATPVGVLPQSVEIGVAVVGALLSLFGRLRARTKIGGVI